MSAIWNFLCQPDVLAVERLLSFLVGVAAFVGLNAAYLVWVERKTAAYVQRRPGPMEVGPQGLIQPIADAVKLLTKQVFVPPGTDAMLFRLAPVLIMTPAIMCFTALPFAPGLVPADINIGLLTFFAFGAINVMALMLGGWSSRNKYAVISSARVVSQDVAYEIPMLLTVITVVMMTGTLNLTEIVNQQAGAIWHWNLFQLHRNLLMPVSFVSFFICMLAETNRAPFDMAEAESELVAGSFTEYAGMGFGVFFMAEYANIVVGCSLATILFLGGWQIPFFALPAATPAWAASLVGAFVFCCKLYPLIFVVMWVRWTFPRTQFYGLLNLSWKVLIPVALGTLLLTSVLIKLPYLF